MGGMVGVVARVNVGILDTRDGSVISALVTNLSGLSKGPECQNGTTDPRDPLDLGGPIDPMDWRASKDPWGFGCQLVGNG